MIMVFIANINFISIEFYNGYLLACNSTLFSGLYIFSITKDNDVDYQLVKLFPILYKNIIKHKIKIKAILLNFFLSIY